MLNSHIASFAASFSWILGRKLVFDPVKNEFVGDAEANSLRSRPERELLGLAVRRQTACRGVVCHPELAPSEPPGERTSGR
jgi:hypothetical protein